MWISACRTCRQEIVGAEALVTGKKEPYGIVPPGMFIDWLESLIHVCMIWKFCF